MKNAIVFGSVVDYSVANILDENRFEKVCDESDLSYGFVLAKIYGFKLSNACVALDSPFLSLMPKVSSPAQDCGYDLPTRAWSIYEHSFNKNKGTVIDLKSSDGISITVEDFHIEDGFFVGVVRLKVVALGAQLINVGIPFKTKNDYTLYDEDINVFNLKVVLSVRAVTPPEVCITGKINGPFGYNDSEKVCVKL